MSKKLIEALYQRIWEESPYFLYWLCYDLVGKAHVKPDTSDARNALRDSLPMQAVLTKIKETGGSLAESLEYRSIMRLNQIEAAIRTAIQNIGHPEDKIVQALKKVLDGSELEERPQEMGLDDACAPGARVQPNGPDEAVPTEQSRMEKKLFEALKALASAARTFRDVPKNKQMWTTYDDEALENAFDVIEEFERSGQSETPSNGKDSESRIVFDEITTQIARR